MTAPIEPATLAFRADGTPFSHAYDDVYHSAAGPFGQARHVFLGGNKLPSRWRGRRLFTILETGFGIGCNFLATWAAWRADPARPERLAFVSIEKHPLSAGDLRVVHARLVASATKAPITTGSAAQLAALPATSSMAPSVEIDELAGLAAQLADAWPLPLPGVHRLEFDEGRVTLTLALGDALQLLPRLWLAADAFYLDGFSPAKNPELWSPPVFKALARVAAAGATLATYSSAGHVRRGLEAVGFACDKAPGFAGKREMLVGAFAPRWRVRRHEPPHPQQLAGAERHAIVIGAGLAGCAVIERLAARGWKLTLLEQHEKPACEASGNPIAVFHPLLSRDDSVASRIARTGFLYALRRWQALEDAGHGFERTRSGLLHLPPDDDEADALAKAAAHLRCPPEFARALSPADVQALVGIDVTRQSWFYAQGGSLNPAALCDALCAAAGNLLTWRGGVRAARLVRDGDAWAVFDEAGLLLARAPVVVLANSHDAVRLAGLRYAPMRRVRGQLTYLPAPLDEPFANGLGHRFATALRIPVIGDGYAAPLQLPLKLPFGLPRNGGLVTGASYELDDDDMSLRASSHRENLVRLSRLVPALARDLAQLDPSGLAGRVGFRCVAGDRLPFAGALADETACERDSASLAGAHPLDLPRAEGLYAAFAFGSRGLVWSSLVAELIASQIEGEPWPMERDLAESLDPGRYLLRALRRGLNV